MNIICDPNLLMSESLFSHLGDVTMIEGRELTHEDVLQADMLIIRSTAKITPSLMEGSHVSFIGSGVIGIDHLDKSYLAERNIPWVSAPGCNAESVADYFITALLSLGQMNKMTWEGKTLGIVGVGHVGTAIWHRAKALGMHIIGCDPFKSEEGYVDFDELLAQSDVVTFHTPLTTDGPYPTYHLFSGARVRKVKPGAVLINMARGSVIESEITCAAIDHGFLSDVIIDCWEGEPDWHAELSSRAFLATPHAAGHAYEGRLNGTLAVYRAACDFLGQDSGEIPALPIPPVPTIEMDVAGLADEDVLYRLTSQVCDIEGDSRRFRSAFSSVPEERRLAFDNLRKNYPMRRLFAATTVTLHHATDALHQKVSGIGFQINR